MKKRHKPHSRKKPRVPVALAGQTVKYSDLKVRRREPRNAPYLEAVRHLAEGESHVIPIAKGDTPSNSYARIWSAIKTHIGPPPAGFVRSLERVQITDASGEGWAVSLKRKGRKAKATAKAKSKK